MWLKVFFFWELFGILGCFRFRASYVYAYGLVLVLDLRGSLIYERVY